MRYCTLRVMALKIFTSCLKVKLFSILTSVNWLNYRMVQSSLTKDSMFQSSCIKMVATLAIKSAWLIVCLLINSMSKNTIGRQQQQLGRNPSCCISRGATSCRVWFSSLKSEKIWSKLPLRSNSINSTSGKKWSPDTQKQRRRTTTYLWSNLVN